MIGNLLDIPKSREWVTYEKWGKEFGSDVIHLNALGTHLVILNSAKATDELFDRRSSLYSDRPLLVALNVILKIDWAMGFSRYGTRWRNMRREFHRYFHPTASQQYRPIEVKATHELIRRLLDTPSEFLEHIRFMAGQTIIKIAYGIDVQQKDDPYVDAAEDVLKAVAFGSTGRAGLVDTFPMLALLPAWFPGNSFKKEAKRWDGAAQRMIEGPYHIAREATVNGTAKPSVAASMIQRLRAGAGPSYLSEDIIKKTSGTMYLAGADTTVAALQIFFFAMLLHPEAQKKAQAEIANVIGTDRLPNFSDEEALPYVGALTKEVFRWRPVSPLAIQHRVIADDIYEGYYIPAGSVVIGNTWAILHDEATFPEPDVFKPERFLPTSADDSTKIPFPDAAFGYGRRICPGRYMARDAVWIAMVSILASFEITKAVDDEGKEIEPKDEFTSGIISYPVPFGCRIRLRSRAMEKLIRESALQG